MLAALHQMHPLLGLDGDFVMVTKADDPLATWVLRSNEPFQPREYVSIGSKADKRSRDSR